MISVLFLLLIIAVFLYFFFGKDWMLHRRRLRVRNLVFPEDKLAIIEKNVPLYRQLSPGLQKELLGHTLVLLNEKSYEGASGLEITEEMKVTIAAQAAILLLNRHSDYFSRLDSVIVYPEGFVARGRMSIDRFHHVEHLEAHIGESWQTGAIILAWDRIKQDILNPHDGHNLILHEFAHQLDQEDGRSDGTPILPKRNRYYAWGKIMGREYQRLRHEVMMGIRDVIDEYGATNEAEFFAVITETFFEEPRQLKQRHAELYEQLKEYYQQDPLQYLK